MRITLLHRKYAVLAALCLLCAAPQAQAQFGYGGTGSSTLDEPPEQQKRKLPPKPADAYVKKIAVFFNTKEDELVRLWNRGYGRNELIKLLLIVQKAHKNVRDISRMRDKNEKFAKIAAKYDLDFDAILTEAQEIRAKIDRAIEEGVPNAETHVSSGNATVSASTETAPTAEVKHSTSTEKKQ